MPIERLYRVPKLHKADCLLRPILDVGNSPYHQIAQWVPDLLVFVHKTLCQFSLVDTPHFVDWIKNLSVNNSIMFPLDVWSHFTNALLQKQSVTCATTLTYASKCQKRAKRASFGMHIYCAARVQ